MLICSSFFYFIQLLQIERDTFGKLQCHPYPHDYVDVTKQCAHCAFFMGLQRKPGEVIQEGRQFDIRGTVEEFRHQISTYSYWKPGMEIYVSHVRRKQIPSYVFPEGYKRSRPPRQTNPKSVDRSPQENGEIFRSGSTEQRQKRKKELEVENGSSPEKRQSVSPQEQDYISPEVFASTSIRAVKDAAELNGVCGTVNQLAQEANTETLRNGGTGFVVENADAECRINSGIVTQLSGEISCNNGRSNDGNEGSVGGSNSHGTSRADTSEADSNLPVNNGCRNSGHFHEEDGLKEELEVLNLVSLSDPNR